MVIRPTLRQLEYLIALDDHRSFSKASDHCAVTQSTLSASIRDLENLLEQDVVDRSHKKVVLTALGEELARESRDIIARVDQALAVIKALKSPFSGPLRLGVIPTIAPYWLPQILPGIEKLYPAVSLQIHEDLSHRLVEKLKNGALDLIVMAFPFDSRGIDHAIVFKEEFSLAAPQDYPNLKKIKRTWDIPEKDLLLLQDGHCLRDHALAACDSKVLSNKAFSATSLPTLIQMVAQGYGVTLLPEMVVAAGGLPKNVVVQSLTTPLATRQIGIAWRKGSPFTADFEAFAEDLKGLIKKA